MDIATGYMNFTEEYMKVLLKAEGRVRLFAGSMKVSVGNHNFYSCTQVIKPHNETKMLILCVFLTVMNSNDVFYYVGKRLVRCQGFLRTTRS